MPTEVCDSTSHHICQSDTILEGEVHPQQYKFPKGNEVGDGSQGCAASTPSQFPEDMRYCSQSTLNSKSACEQSGGKIARKTIITKFEKAGDGFLTMDEVSKLGRASTDRKRKAFFWFFGKFLECVSGKSRWGGKKSLELVSKAKDQDGSGQNHVVTRSDKAFALLIFENYIKGNCSYK
jgi:hypothetical protein